MFLTTFNTKSCSRDRFVAYLEGRRLVAHHFRAEPGPGFAGNLASFYRGAYFRSRKYSSYLAKKASEDKLVDRIRNTFGKSHSSQTSSNVNKAIVIFWGCAAPRHSGEAAKLGTATQQPPQQPIHTRHRPETLHPQKVEERCAQQHHLLRDHFDHVGAENPGFAGRVKDPEHPAYATLVDVPLSTLSVSTGRKSTERFVV